MPNHRQRLAAVFISAAILAGGAWAASLVPGAGASADELRTGETRQGLSVTVKNIRNTRGQVIVLVMEDAHAYQSGNYEAAVGYLEIPASTGSVRADFPELAGGRYAVIAFHDENRNRDLDLEGEIPVEGYALSGARDAYDEPPFQRAASKDPTRTIKMHYLK
ncbi:DUF2141 domain-containing protein [Roseibium sp.]|uniref:DUF2141 domain-containing protein n=1 Tax=Roseibium sp. TaxID=1936156 RepID=UPI003BAF0511